MDDHKEIPETIYAWVWEGGELVFRGGWSSEPILHTTTPYIRADLVEAQRAECVEVLRGLVDLEDSNPNAMAGDKWDLLYESLLPTARAAIAKARGEG